MGGFGYEEASYRPEKVEVWDKRQKALFDQLSQHLQQGMSGGVPSYPGQMYAPTLPAEQQYFDWAKDTAGMRQQALQQIGSGTVPYKIGPQWAEGFYEQGVRDPALREHEQITLPGIKEAHSGPGYWGSARANAESLASGNLATTLAQQKAGLMYGEEQAHRQAQEAALGRQAMYGPSAYAAEGALMGTAGQYARQIENEKILGDFQRWVGGETVGGVSPTHYNPYLQLIFQALGLTPYALGQTGESFGINASVKATPATPATPGGIT